MVGAIENVVTGNVEIEMASGKMAESGFLQFTALFLHPPRRDMRGFTELHGGLYEARSLPSRW